MILIKQNPSGVRRQTDIDRYTARDTGRNKTASRQRRWAENGLRGRNKTASVWTDNHTRADDVDAPRGQWASAWPVVRSRTVCSCTTSRTTRPPSASGSARCTASAADATASSPSATWRRRTATAASTATCWRTPCSRSTRRTRRRARR